jgi:antitoxin (DNA-binding transcriptional repressor) of toxin-antitoxin stability system
MATTLSIDDFPEHTRSQLDRVVHGSETIVLMEAGKAVAEIRPVPPQRDSETIAQLFRNLPHLTPEEAEAFGRDIDEARRAADRIPVRDPWQS